MVTTQGCCAEALHSVGQACSLAPNAFTNFFVFSRYRNGVRAWIPSNTAPLAGLSIGEEIQEMVNQTSNIHNSLYPIPKPTQIMFTPSDYTTSADPIGFEQVNGGGNIQMATITWTGDLATPLLERDLNKMFTECGDRDIVFGDDFGALVGIKKVGYDLGLFGFQVVRSTVRIKFDPAVNGSSVRTLTLMFQVLKEPKNSTYMAVISSNVLGYDSDDLKPLRYFTGLCEAITTTELSFQMSGDSADASKRLYLVGFTGATPQVLQLENVTANTFTAISSGDIVENFVPDDQVTNTNGTSYTVTITAATTGDLIRLVATGIGGYEKIVSNTVEAL